MKKESKLYTTHGNENNPDHILKRLINAVDIDNNTCCWGWNKFTNKDGYGSLTLNRKSQLAHRVMYYLVFGEFDNYLSVCHKCDNPKCINPYHLFLGTKSDNMKDCFDKGRSKIKPVSFKGSNNPMSKLTHHEAMEIRKVSLSGNISQKTIADNYGISQSQVSLIKLGKLWK